VVGYKVIYLYLYIFEAKKNLSSVYVISPQVRTETTQEVEMEDFPIQQENQSFVQLCARLFPSKRSSAFRGRHSLFRQQRRVALKESPLHAAMTAIMKW
jgi:hypothetical protein